MQLVRLRRRGHAGRSHRRPGRFLLTGSANVLLLPTLADSLAGRMEILRLHPLAQCELARAEPAFLDTLFRDGFSARPYARLGKELVRRIVAGGYQAALARTTTRRRAIWYRDYVTLLERIFLLEELPPWHNNRLSRLITTPQTCMRSAPSGALRARHPCGYGAAGCSSGPNSASKAIVSGGTLSRGVQTIRSSSTSGRVSSGRQRSMRRASGSTIQYSGTPCDW